MKKFINPLLVVIFISLTLTKVFAVDVPIDLYINDINVRPDSKPYISETNRTMVPISFVANEFKFKVVWNAKDKEVIITKNGKEVKLYIDSKYAYVDNQRVEIDPGKSTAVVIRNGRTMVPVAFVAKTFDVEVGWVAYPRGGGIVKFYSKDYVKPVSGDYPLAPGNQTFVEGKALDPSIIPGAKQTIGNNKTVPVVMTDAKEVKISKSLVIYPHTLIQAKNENGDDRIYMKVSGGGEADIFYYKDGKKVGSLATGDRHNGWMLVSGATNYNAYDYMIIYGTEDKMVPRYPELSGTFNQSIKTIDATKFN